MSVKVRGIVQFGVLAIGFILLCALLFPIMIGGSARENAWVATTLVSLLSFLPAALLYSIYLDRVRPIKLSDLRPEEPRRGPVKVMYLRRLVEELETLEDKLV